MIVNKNGLPLFTKGVGEEDTPDKQILVGGFLTAIQQFAEQVSESSIDKMELKGVSFYYSNKDPIMSVIVADDSDDVEVECKFYQIIAERLGRTFMDKYGQIFARDEWNGDTSIFKGFNQDYERILEEILEMMRQSHREFIADYFVTAASDENIVGLIVFDLDQDIIIAKDIPDDFTATEKDFEAFSSMLFAFTNRLGAALKVGAIDEIVMRAKDHWIGGMRKKNLAVFMIFTHDYFGNIIPDIVHTAI